MPFGSCGSDLIAVLLCESSDGENFMVDYNLLLTVTALALTVIALFISFRQTRDLDKIRRSISTQYIGEFPDYIPEITALIERARKEVIIFCDFPTYGRHYLK